MYNTVRIPIRDASSSPPAEELNTARLDPINERPSDDQILAARMKQFGLQEKTSIVGDGNCQFRALADQLYDNQDLHYIIRRKVVEWLYKNRDFPIDDHTRLQDFLETDCYRDWDSYCNYLAQDASWGDHITLVAAAEIFRITICVISTVTAPGHTDPITVIEPKAKQSTKTVYLSHWHESHYSSLCLDVESNKLSALAAAISKQVTKGPASTSEKHHHHHHGDHHHHQQSHRPVARAAEEVDRKRVEPDTSDEDGSDDGAEYVFAEQKKPERHVITPQHRTTITKPTKAHITSTKPTIPASHDDNSNKVKIVIRDDSTPSFSRRNVEPLVPQHHQEPHHQQQHHPRYSHPPTRAPSSQLHPTMGTLWDLMGDSMFSMMRPRTTGDPFDVFFRR